MGYIRWHYAQRRLDSFGQTLAQQGMTCASLTNFHGDRTAGQRAPEGTIETLSRWLKNLPKPCGVFAVTDRLASLCQRLCRQEGLDIPGEIGILGVGNDELLCEAGMPFLSSVCIPWKKLGYQAAALLDQAFDGQRRREEPVWIPPEGIAPRRSTDFFWAPDPALRAAGRFIREKALNGPVLISEVARTAGMSRRSLERSFHRHFQRTIRQEIERVRILYAQQILRTTDWPIKKVAYDSGFGGPSSFGAIFRKITGLTPLAFRNKAQSGRMKGEE